jgi:hypothetical protein
MLRLRHAVISSMSCAHVRGSLAMSVRSNMRMTGASAVYMYPVKPALAYMQLIRGQLYDCLLKDIHMIA